MKTIPLTRGRVALVDDEDYAELAQYQWYAQSRRGYFYAARWDNNTAPRKIISMHRVIARARDGDIVDHIDGNQMNNQRSNLRLVTRSANNQNSRKRAGSVSLYRGVRKLHRKFAPPKWRAVINHEGVRHDAGCFASEKEASLAYNALALKLGSLCPLNEVI